MDNIEKDSVYCFKVLGPKLRPNQNEAIQHFLVSVDIFVSLPTESESLFDKNLAC